MTLFAGLPPDQLPLWAEFYRRALREGTTVCQHALPDGARFEMSFSPIEEDGTVTGVSVFGRDITLRSGSEAAIQEAERKYREIFEDAPEGIFRTTSDGVPIALNPAGAQLLGYESPAQAASEIRSFQDDVWHDRMDRIPFVSALETAGRIRGYRTRFRRRDGVPVWVSITANRVCGPDGQVLYYQGFCEDISGQIILESELGVKLREVQLLSEMNSALLRTKTEKGLLEEYCRIIVEIGGYLMAWVGFAEDTADKPLVPVASFGRELGLLGKAGVSWGETPAGSGPSGRAIRSGKIQVSEMIATDPSMAPWHDICDSLGFRSLISLPFRHSDGKMACLTAYSDRCAPWTHSERGLMEQVSAQLGFGITTVRTALAKSQYQEQLHLSLEQTIQVISETIDQRDPYTAGHQRRVADLCTHIAAKLQVPPDRIQGLTLAANIHDLGKVGIPAEILSKPGHLTPSQFNLLKEHVELGCDIIRNVSFPWPIEDIIRQHHERLDGSGYPHGLRGDALLLESKILAVADVVEAMSSHRPYRPSLGIGPALDQMIQDAGSLYDRQVVDACVRLFREEGYEFPAHERSQ